MYALYVHFLLYTFIFSSLSWSLFFLCSTIYEFYRLTVCLTYIIPGSALFDIIAVLLYSLKLSLCSCPKPTLLTKSKHVTLQECMSSGGIYFFFLNKYNHFNLLLVKDLLSHRSSYPQFIHLHWMLWASQAPSFFSLYFCRAENLLRTDIYQDPTARDCAISVSSSVSMSTQVIPNGIVFGGKTKWQLLTRAGDKVSKYIISFSSRS